MLICKSGFIPRGTGPYAARSASDKTDDWPYWYVCGADGRTNLLTLPKDHPHYGAVLTDRETAKALAAEWNAAMRVN